MISQIIAVLIFLVMFVEIVREKVPRYLVALLAGAVTIVVVFLCCMRSPAAVWEALSFQSMADTGFWYALHGEGEPVEAAAMYSQLDQHTAAIDEAQKQIVVIKAESERRAAEAAAAAAAEREQSGDKPTQTAEAEPEAEQCTSLEGGDKSAE